MRAPTVASQWADLKVALAWKRALDRMNIPFSHDANYRVMRFERSRQLVFPRAAVSLSERHALIHLAQMIEPRLSHWRSDPPTPDYAVIIAGRDGEFLGIDCTAARRLPPCAIVEIETAVELMHCLACDGWWFASSHDSWRCQVCDHYDGNADVYPMLESPLRVWPFAETYREAA